MNYEDRQKYDKAVDKMLKEKLEVGITFGVFAIVAILGLIFGICVYLAFN